MSMNSLERDIIEYRPQIGLNPRILAKIVKTANDRPNTTYTPTLSIKERTKKLKTDVVDSLLLTKQTLESLLSSIRKRIHTHPDFERYQKAKKEGDLPAEEVYMELIKDIDAPSDMGVYPILEDLKEEIDDYLEFVNDMLFDGKLDINDLDTVRKEEENQVTSWLEIESEDLSFPVKPVLTPQQITLIQKVIEDEYSGIDSIDDYIEQLRLEQLAQGSSRIPYTQVIDETRLIHTLFKKAEMFQKTVGSFGDFHNQTLLQYMNEDVEGSLAYLVDIPGALPDLAELSKMTFRYHADSTENAYMNMQRIGSREFRSYLDRNLKNLYEKKKRYVNQLRQVYQSTDIQNPGATGVIWKIEDGIRAVHNLWIKMMTDHLTLSEQNTDQFEVMQNHLMEKKGQQILYRYYDLVTREFDFENKEKDLIRFPSTYHLHSFVW